MKARTGSVALISAIVALAATPASASTETIVMTAPYHSSHYDTTCPEVGPCANSAGADSVTGHEYATLVAAGVHGGLDSTAQQPSAAESWITAQHAVPDLKDQEREVESIRYTVQWRTEHQRVVAAFGVLEHSLAVTHSLGTTLEGAQETWSGGVSGAWVNTDPGTDTVTIEVTGVDGSAIPSGEMDVTFGLHLFLVGPSHTVCEGEVCASASAAAGVIDHSLYVERITAQIVSRSV